MIRNSNVIKNNKQDIVFQICDWKSYDIYTKKEEDDENNEEEDENKFKNKVKRLVIVGYGITSAGNSISIHVHGFEPYFYIEVPIEWTNPKIYSLINYIKKNIKNETALKGFKSYNVVEKKKFYGFTGYKNFKFVRLVFLNMKSFKAFEYWIEYNKINDPFLFKIPTKLKIYESKYFCSLVLLKNTLLKKIRRR